MAYAAALGRIRPCVVVVPGAGPLSWLHLQPLLHLLSLLAPELNIVRFDASVRSHRHSPRPTLRAQGEVLAEELAPLKPHANSPLSEHDVHFVTHGTGALVLRSALSHEDWTGVRSRVVMLAPTNRGSVLARRLFAPLGPGQLLPKAWRDRLVPAELTRDDRAFFDSFGGVPSAFQTLVVAGSGLPRSPGNPLIRRCGPHDGVVCLRDTDLFSDAAYRSSKQADEASGRRRLLRSLSSEPGGKRRAADEAGSSTADGMDDRGTAAVRGSSGTASSSNGRVYSPNIARALVPFGHVSMLYAPSVLQAAVRFIRHCEPGIPVESIPGLPETAQWRDTHPPAAPATHASSTTIATAAGSGAGAGVAAAQLCLKRQWLSNEPGAGNDGQMPTSCEKMPRVDSGGCPPLAHSLYKCDSPLQLTAGQARCIERTEARWGSGLRAAAAEGDECSYVVSRHLSERNPDVTWHCERGPGKACHDPTIGVSAQGSCRVLSSDCHRGRVEVYRAGDTSALASWTADGTVRWPSVSLQAPATSNTSAVALLGPPPDPAVRATHSICGSSSPHVSLK
jgi:hypothetical protein